MSDNPPGDNAPPARKPRKAAPRRRKPAPKAAAKAEAPASPVDSEAAVEVKATQVRRTRPAAPTKPTTPPAPVTPPTAAPSPRVLIRVPLAVRWRDLDAFNHVNNSKYLSYLEEARLQWMLTMPGQGLDALVARPSAAPVPGNWKPYLEKLPKDPWGAPYQYVNPGVKGAVDVFSFGADNQTGGEGKDADIGSWE